MEESIQGDDIDDCYNTAELTPLNSVESGYHEGDSVIGSTDSYTSRLDQCLDDRDFNLNENSNRSCEVGWMDDEDTRESYDNNLENDLSEKLTGKQREFITRVPNLKVFLTN